MNEIMTYIGLHINGIQHLKFAIEIIDKAKEFIKNLNLPTISLDVWVDLKNNKFGLFEWSTEYGLDYPKDTLKYLSKELTKSVENILLN